MGHKVRRKKWGKEKSEVRKWGEKNWTRKVRHEKIEARKVGLKVGREKWGYEMSGAKTKVGQEKWVEKRRVKKVGQSGVRKVGGVGRKVGREKWGKEKSRA